MINYHLNQDTKVYNQMEVIRNIRMKMFKKGIRIVLKKLSMNINK